MRGILVNRGMAYVDSEGEVRLNRKGRRFLESHAGKPAVKRLREGAAIKQAEVKRAWAEKNKLGSLEKSQPAEPPVS